MPNLFIVLGNENTRKSSTIRALTGIYRESNYLIETHPGNMMVFAKSSSLQESKIQPMDFIHRINTENFDNVLTALWIHDYIYTDPATGQQIRYPTGIEYVRDFLTANWHIQQIVVLGTNGLPNPLPAGCPTPNYVPNSAAKAANEISSDVRRWWNWL